MGVDLRVTLYYELTLTAMEHGTYDSLGKKAERRKRGKKRRGKEDEQG